ncbi:hypothetical protein ACFQVA_15820 [Actinomadura keratinilytica]
MNLGGVESLAAETAIQFLLPSVSCSGSGRAASRPSAPRAAGTRCCWR